ncbi:MAG: hypothetical protein DRI57_30765 [Deltaproteobacteria bacterium]|nr:MAG: hypothetical protein DRI57_30765 [Deltaproteobacteria bacterium]
MSFGADRKYPFLIQTGNRSCPGQPHDAFFLCRQSGSGVGELSSGTLLLAHMMKVMLRDF